MNNLSLKYQKFTPPDCKDMYGISKYEVVEKAQFFYSSHELAILNLA